MTDEELEEMMRHDQQVQATIDLLERQVADARTRAERAEEENGTLRLELADAKRGRDALAVDLDEAEGENRRLRAELAEARAVFEQAAPRIAQSLSLVEMIRACFAVQGSADLRPVSFADRVDVRELSPAQRSGQACVKCGTDLATVREVAGPLYLLTGERVAACGRCWDDRNDEESGRA